MSPTHTKNQPKKPNPKSRTRPPEHKYHRRPETRRLSPDEVRAIRESYAQSTATTCAQLARRYGVAPSLIHAIVVGTLYQDCPGPLTQPEVRGRPRGSDCISVRDEVEVTVTRAPAAPTPPRRTLGPGYVVRLQDAALSVGQTGPLMAVDSHEDEHGRVRVTWLAQGYPRFARLHWSNLQIVGGRLLGGSSR